MAGSSKIEYGEKYFSCESYVEGGEICHCLKTLFFPFPKIPFPSLLIILNTIIVVWKGMVIISVNYGFILIVYNGYVGNYIHSMTAQY